MNNKIKLTQYSHGAGCGCKISPKVLDVILNTGIQLEVNENLIVGNHSRDDAAVYDLGDGTVVISTTDFFLPIVDDPFEFGKIAAVNAISDIYAMGGNPLLAIAILGWPVNKIAPEIAAKVMEGGKSACKEAGIPLAGGHSIDNPEPIFGLAVTGKVEITKLKQNSSARVGSRLFLTKPLGVGILATAQKQGILKIEHYKLAPNSMMLLNKVGVELSNLDGVSAMTDVTGFGLLGHLLEMCEGSNVSAVIDYSKVPIFPEALAYLKEGAIPGGTTRNWDSYGSKIKSISSEQKHILCDPQTSGGLLIAVDENEVGVVEKILQEQDLYAIPFGYLTDKKEELIKIDN